jgi:hypothetical protein
MQTVLCEGCSTCHVSITSDGGGSAPEEMQDEHHDTDYQQYVNDASGNVKGKEPKQPENDENCGD